MKLGTLTFGALLRLWAAAVTIFASVVLMLVLVLNWVERNWPSDDRRSVTEAELRPDRLHFRPIEGDLAPAAWSGTTYVPVYSTVYLGDREVQPALAVTLSLRNTSPDHELVVHRVDYYDTGGKTAMRLVDRPHAVPAMATAEFFIDRHDPIGGPGANYLVEWSVPEGGTEPLVEAVMVGRLGRAGITFVSRGAVIRSGEPGGTQGSRPGG